MGGFAKLKGEFDAFFDGLNPRTDKNDETYRQDVFRALYLRSLFEIAGNLDSIALHTRALVEQSEKARLAAEKSNELTAELIGISKQNSVLMAKSTELRDTMLKGFAAETAAKPRKTTK